MPSSKTLVTVLFGLLLGVMLASAVSFTAAQPTPQVPSIQSPNKTAGRGQGIVLISGQTSGSASGKVSVVKLDVHYDPATDAFPTGTLVLRMDLDESPNTTVESETVDQLTSYGKHTPTMVLSGRCRVVHANQKEPLTGCRYWALVADNGKGQQEKHTPDVLSFLVVDKMGKRIAYGTGPIVEGDLHVEPTSN